MKEVMIWLRCSYNSVMYVEVSDGNKTRVLKKSLSNLISKEQSIRSCSGHHASQALSNQRQRIEKNKSTTPKRSKASTNGFHWEWAPSPASVFQQAFEILPSRDHEGLTVDPPA